MGWLRYWFLYMPRMMIWSSSIELKLAETSKYTQIGKTFMVLPWKYSFSSSRDQSNGDSTASCPRPLCLSSSRMYGYQYDSFPCFFSYIRYRARQASSESLFVVSNSAAESSQTKDSFRKSQGETDSNSHWSSSNITKSSGQARSEIFHYQHSWAKRWSIMFKHD